MESKEYIHAIHIDKVKCVGCSHCMRICSTQAIRIVGGQAHIMPERCVDCGECYRVCPSDAIYVLDDGFASLNTESYNIALVPSVFIGQFSTEYTASQILQAVKEIGFDEVMEVEMAVDFIKYEYQKLAKTERQHPLISSYCPAIVRLIQVQYPSLTDWVMQLKAPHDIAANYLNIIKNDDEAAIDKVHISYITPCASKIIAAKAPVGELVSPIHSTINMKEIFNKVSVVLSHKKKEEDKMPEAGMSPDSFTWSLSGTEKKYFPGRSMAIDGMNNAIEFLDKLESGHITDIDFLEMRACDQGCAGGILCPGNRFLTVERLEHRRQKLQHHIDSTNTTPDNKLLEYKNVLEQNSRTEPIHPREGLLLDENVEIALLKMDRIEKLLSFLPGFDCGACGAPTCKSLAEDIIKDKASMSHCVFVQRVMEKNYKLSPDQSFKVIEKVWGDNRLNKYQIDESSKH